MAIIKEPKGIDFAVKSEPWSDKELKEFKTLIKKQKSKLGKKERLRLEEEFEEISKQPA
jgi:hypothetical protein